MIDMNPELLWKSKNERWQIYLDNSRFTIDDTKSRYVYYPVTDSNGKTEFPHPSEIPKYVKERFLRIRKKHLSS